MEQILSTIFPCCFPNRRSSRSRDAGSSSSGLLNERTPLLGGQDTTSPGSASGHESDSAAASGSDTTRAKRKHNSILPAPTYDAHALKAIMDDFKAKLIAVDANEKTNSNSAAQALLAGGVEEIKQPNEAEEGMGGEEDSTAAKGGKKHVTPVHSLRVSISSSSAGNTASTQPKLVDIWTDPAAESSTTTSSSVGAGSGTILSYSAAVQRGKKATAKSKGRFGGGAPKPLSSTTSAAAAGAGGAVGMEQKTYESLNEIVKHKPLVHDWDLDEPGEGGHGES